MPKLILTVEVPQKFIGTIPVTASAQEKLSKMAALMGIKVLNVEALPDEALVKS